MLLTTFNIYDYIEIHFNLTRKSFLYENGLQLLQTTIKINKLLTSYWAMQSNVLWLTFKFFHAAKEKMIRNYSFIINFHNVDIYMFLSKLHSI